MTDSLEYLLDLDGEVIVQERDYWIQIKARKLDPDGHRIKAYDFTNAGQLLEDFFAAVDIFLKDGNTS